MIDTINAKNVHTKIILQKQQNGITLIALVITIAILIILAGVTINVAFGKDGIINSAGGFSNRIQEAQDQKKQELNNLLEESENIMNQEEVDVVKNITWNNEKATLKLTATIPGYTIYYKLSNGEYTQYTAPITNLVHGNSVEVKLTNENKPDKILTVKITDSGLPTATIQLSTNSTEIGKTITATVTHTDGESGVNITSCKYIYNTIEAEIGTTSSAWNSATAFNSNAQKVNLTSTEKGTYYLHVLTTDKANNKKETISQAVVVDGKTLENLMAEAATKNESVLDKYGNPITVPKGFSVVSPTEDSTVIYAYDKVNGTSTQKPVVQDGIVIKDSAGNQFVWIPVGEIKNDAVENTTNKTTITLGRYTFDVGTKDSTTNEYDGTGEEHLVQAAYTDTNPTNYINTDGTIGLIDNKFSELSIQRNGIASSGADGLNATAKDLAGFVESVKTKGGYYIARYEASYGSGYNSSGTTDELKYANAKPLSQPSTANSTDSMNYIQRTLWNFITQLNAAKVAKNMYAGNKDINNNEVGVESDLINSYAWDTAIVFIQKYSSNTAYSKQKSKSSSLANTGERTGVTDKVCNIYDMGSNTGEWSTEYSTYTYNNNAWPCVFRGGNCITNNYYTASRFGTGATNSSYYYLSFRPTLYVRSTGS